MKLKHKIFIIAIIPSILISSILILFAFLNFISLSDHFIIIISILIISFFSSFLISVYLSKKIYCEISKMKNILTELKNGKIETKKNFSSISEINDLMNALDELVLRIDEEYRNRKKLEKIRSEFLGNVSHELRTPIFSIQGYVETLLSGAINDSSVNIDFLERIYKHTERLNNLLGDLVEISKIESGELKLSYRFFDIIELISSIVEEMKSIAQKNGYNLYFEKPEVESISVFADKERIRQVLINLLDNALNYNRKNGYIKIELKNDEKNVAVTVEDSGIGIPQEHIPRIFERFYRVDKTRSREIGGTGLGLAIVKHIIEAHKGDIKVESKVGIGSRFSFTISKNVNIK